MRAVPSIAMIRAFEIFGRHGGIRKTAQCLNVDHAVVSRHLRSLEAFVGTALIDRSGMDRWLTPDGETYHARVSAALREICDATEALRCRDARRLVVWSAPGLAFHWLTRELPRFRARYPDIEIEMRPSDRAPDFATNEADVDIRYIHGSEAAKTASIVRTIEIARPPILPVASPDFVATMPLLADPADLAEQCLLHEDSDMEWRIWLAAQGVEVTRDLPGPRMWHGHLTLDAARRGQGIALSNPLLAGSDLAEGRLVVVEAGGPMNHIPLGAYFLSVRADRWTTLPMARFRDWLRANLPADGVSGSIVEAAKAMSRA